MFPDIMIYPDFKAPPNLWDVPLLPKITTCLDMRASPIFLDVPCFLDIMIFLDMRVQTNFVDVLSFLDIMIYPDFRVPGRDRPSGIFMKIKAKQQILNCLGMLETGTFLILD